MMWLSSDLGLGMGFAFEISSHQLIENKGLEPSWHGT
jgi:hypothetical protein